MFCIIIFYSGAFKILYYSAKVLFINTFTYCQYILICNNAFIFQSEIVSQDSLDVLIKPKFDFVGRLKELIKPIIEKRKSSWESASSTSTPPPPFNLPAASSSVAVSTNHYIHIIFYYDS